MRDEATRNLDTETERMIPASFNALMENRTCFVNAHRLSTITHADRVVVLQTDRIIEIGSHELMAAGSRYREMAYAANAAGGCVMTTTRAIAT